MKKVDHARPSYLTWNVISFLTLVVWSCISIKKERKKEMWSHVHHELEHVTRCLFQNACIKSNSSRKDNPTLHFARTLTAYLSIFICPLLNNKCQLTPKHPRGPKVAGECWFQPPPKGISYACLINPQPEHTLDRTNVLHWKAWTCLSSKWGGSRRFHN